MLQCGDQILESMEKRKQQSRVVLSSRPSPPQTTPWKVVVEKEESTMPAVPVMMATKGKNKTKEGRRGRPRKTHFPSLPPVSRRSSLRTPRRQLREDFYNVDEIVVDDEEEEVQERGEVEEEMEEEEEEEEEKFRSKKKLKLLLKLNQHHNHQIPTRPPNPTPVTKPRTVRRSGSSHFSEEEEEEGRSDGNRRCGGDDNDEDEVDDDILHRDGRRNLGLSSTSSTSRKGTPLPDMKTLVLILDKIQKKDKYAVFRDPVDPEELPDYHDVIEHPMDFSTIRKKLARNVYSNLEQFESDIFLLCSNAMQYNAPETIYHKQASSMQELARKKFHNVRAGSKSCEISPNDNKILFSNLVKEKLIEDQLNSLCEKKTDELRDTDSCKPTDKPVFDSPKPQAKSEISPAPDHAMNEIDGAELKNTRPVTPNKLDNVTLSTANNVVYCEALPEKLDEPSEKNVSPSPGQKSTSLDEDRRATYITSNQHPPVEADSHSLFSILNSEKKLVALGLDEENSYARSLARFSASLGSVVWRIASGKIEKTIPAGLQFGPGWVGEYEAPIRPIFSSENYLQQLSGKTEKSGYKTEFRDDRVNYDDCRDKEASIPKNTQMGTTLGSQSAELYNCVSNAVDGPFVKEALFGVKVGNQHRIGSDTLNQQGEKSTGYASNIRSNNNEKAGIPTNACNMMNYRSDMTLQQSCLKSSEVVSQGSCTTNGGGVNSFLAPPKENPGSLDMNHRNRSNMKSCLSNTSEHATEKSIVKVGRLQVREDGTNSSAQKANGSSVFKSPTPAGIMSNSIPNGSMNQKIDDPSQLIRMLPGDFPNNPNSCYTTKQFIPPVLSPRNHSGAALATTGHAWMPARTSSGHEAKNASGNSEGQIRSPSANKPTWILSNSMSGQNSFHGVQELDNRRPVSQFAPKSCQIPISMQGVQNKSTVAFPQIFTTELPRFQLHSPWQGFVPVAQQRQSKGMCPPDLNIGFQSPGSPAQQSSGIHVDSQQPDLALQL